MAIVYCDSSENCFSQQPWEKTKEDMKRVFKANGIKVSYEAKMPMEHELKKFDQVLDEIKTRARSKFDQLEWFTQNIWCFTDKSINE